MHYAQCHVTMANNVKILDDVEPPIIILLHAFFNLVHYHNFSSLLS
jgi:hypothetical protein